MSEHFQQVGFSRLIRLDWLEYTSNLVVAGNEGKDIYEALDEYLKDILAVGNNKSGSVRDRTIRILTKIWVNNPPRLKSLSKGS